MKKIQFFILSISLGIFALCDIGFSQGSTYYADLIADFNIINKQTSAEWYRLDSTLTRAELAKIATNLWGISLEKCTWTIYTDVKSSLWDLCWYIETLARGKIVSTSNKYYRPNDTVTRAEAIKILLGVIWEWKSSINSGYMDVNNLGDLEWYINKAKEIWSIADAKYIYPNSSILRHEVFILTAFYAGIDTSNPAFVSSNEQENATQPTVAEKNIEKSFDKYLLGRIWYDSNFLAYANMHLSEAEFASKCDSMKKIELEYQIVPEYLYTTIKKSDNPCREWASYWIYDTKNNKGMYRDADTYYAFSCDFDYDDEWKPYVKTSGFSVLLTDSEKKICWEIWLSQE